MKGMLGDWTGFIFCLGVLGEQSMITFVLVAGLQCLPHLADHEVGTSDNGCIGGTRARQEDTEPGVGETITRLALLRGPRSCRLILTRGMHACLLREAVPLSAMLSLAHAKRAHAKRRASLLVFTGSKGLAALLQ